MKNWKSLLDKQSSLGTAHVTEQDKVENRGDARKAERPRSEGA